MSKSFDEDYDYHTDPDYDPTPYGAEMVTDPADSPSYKGLAA